MIVRELEACPSGVPAAALSAWHDGETSSSMAQHIAAHIPGCPTCRARLAQYDASIAALRAQHEPAADERQWQELRARIAADGARTAPAGGARKLPARRVWAGLGALAAVALLIVSFATLLRVQPGRPPTSRATPTARPGTPTPLQLSWIPVSLPAGVELNSFNGFATVNRDTVYVCAVPQTSGAASVFFWVSHDRAASWTAQSTLPVARHDITQCSLIVDSNVQNILAVVSWQRGNAFPPIASQEAAYYSDDAGASWQPVLNAAAVNIDTFTTYQGVIYAQMADVQRELATNQPNGMLMASRDGMRTWQRIDGPIVAAHDVAEQFWMAPDTGEMLVLAAYNGPSANPTGAPIEQLFDSRDLGATWTAQPLRATTSVWIAQPLPGVPWTLCRTSYETTENPLTPILECSMDRGKTWQTRPYYHQGAVTIPAVGTPGAGPSDDILGVGGHGDVYAQVGGQLYRHAPGMLQWQMLGKLPTQNWFVYPISDERGDVLWALPSFLSPGGANTPIREPIYWAVVPPS